MAKQTQLPQQQQDVKPLDVTIFVKNTKNGADVIVHIMQKDVLLYQAGFKMLADVPLEAYVKTTFGMYNASLCSNDTENS